MDIPRKFTERWEMLNEMYDKQALSYTYHNKTSLKQGAHIHQLTAYFCRYFCIYEVVFLLGERKGGGS